MTKVKEGDDLGNYNDELMHYGILGMKWGVRRYRNADGTLTSAGKKRDARWAKHNPGKAERAVKLRDSVIESKKASIARAKKRLEIDQKVASADIKSIDFEKEARKQLKDQLRYLKESYEMGHFHRKPTDSDAIDSFYLDLGMITPKGATVKDVANVIRADTEIMKKNKLYDVLIEDDKKAISQGEQIIKSISEMPLKEIYSNQNGIYYDYWKDRGYYD